MVFSHFQFEAFQVSVHVSSEQPDAVATVTASISQEGTQLGDSVTHSKAHGRT